MKSRCSHPVRYLCAAMLALLAASAATPAAAADAGLAGHWAGGIDVPGRKLEIDLDFERAGDGAWRGDISIPAQGAADLPLAEIVLDGSTVSFSMPGVPGSPSFKGTLAADGASISGDFSQGGRTFPFQIERADRPSAVAAERLRGFDAFVDKAIADMKVPGLAVAIVKDGEVVYLKGHGMRDVAKGLAVTPKTLFAIGSSTKAFTTFVMGTLVDEGRLAWDRPVAEVLPGFRMNDEVASRRLTVRDLVTHRSGLPRHDALWYNSTLSRKELVERIAYLEPFRDLRAEFHYQNLMYLTAGYLVEVVTGGSWEDAVRSRILEPLGMKSTNFSVLESQRSDDFARGYREDDERVVEMPFRVITNMGPAGSINSSAEEMVPWLDVQLGLGKAGDRTLISTETLRDMHLPHMAMAIPPEKPEMPQISYGMGWFIQPYRGHNRIHHGGNIDGFSAMVSFLPQDRIGIVTLANRNGTSLPELVQRHAIDRLLDLSPIDWVGEAVAKRGKAAEAEKEAKSKKDLARVKGTKPAHPLDAYAGEYEHPGYGRLTVRRAGEGLEFTYNGMTSPLEHWHYEVFNAGKGGSDPALEDTRLMFVTDMKGDVDALEVPLEPEVKNIVFKRLPDPRMSDPAYLRRFEGRYELSGDVMTIELKGSTLIAILPGQPPYELEPGRLDAFTLKRFSVISMTFVSDAKGAVTEVLVSQPEGVFTGKRMEPKAD